MPTNSTIPMTTTQAAEYLGLSPHTVRMYVSRGLLVAKPLGPINVITQEECDRYKRERKPRGNPNFTKNEVRRRRKRA